ncbi:hypothetical protein SDRG_10476 [Saprolegnia diclina VS20]|uniref:Transmembrane protein n=1 Tax=Saprolegnia diclina (strain VS20) TaxID=1156394 RepID=T0RPR5_SAPDV|nr:hypothetical protein SDRG_10476 [Saprolegnia diclina VS20]EQC31962.1 hypothetical protein SDRG_10476 [Saprolegnia diclina VS20]|eukprot:XP_008614690.1 hypothetical protein SDRG_10476 [Saprolegnia diclina VS20]
MWLRGIVSSYLTRRYLTTSGDASTAHTDASKPATHHGETKDKTARYRMWYRILSNLMAALLICLSLLMLGIVIGQGTFHREVVQYHAQDESIYWNDFGANCLLRSGGFVPHSCAVDETNITGTIEAWDGFGVALAAALDVPPQATYSVSTCWMGATPAIGWASFQVVVGYDYFPACNPTNGSQLVAGVAMLETAARPGFPLGVYLLTAFSDVRMNTSYSYVGSDGVVTPIVAGLSHTIITPNGSVYADDIGMNSIITSHPLGPRYAIVSYNNGQILNMTPYLGTLKGWCTGRDSKLPILTGWFVGHTVMNGDELLALQLLFSALSIYLFAGDVYMTIEGLKGVLRNKPVLTYDVLSGLERRKLLMLCITLNSMPSILYIDVARIYYGTDSGLKIWVIATVSLSIFAAFMGFLAMTLLQYLPAAPKLRYKLISFSAPLFLYGSIGFVAGNIESQMQTLNLQFNSGAFNLAFYARGTFWASGAYGEAGVPTAIGQLLPRMWPPVLWALLIATVYSKLMRFLEGRPLLVHIEWAATNDFLSACGLPKYISSMPLGQHQGIKIGNRTFCKPSTQVLFGS